MTTTTSTPTATVRRAPVAAAYGHSLVGVTVIRSAGPGFTHAAGRDIACECGDTFPHVIAWTRHASEARRVARAAQVAQSLALVGVRRDAAALLAP